MISGYSASANRKILPIGNYPLSYPQSILRFAELLCRLYSKAGHGVWRLQPLVRLGRWAHDVVEHGPSKWLGYIDCYVLFRFTLRRALLGWTQQCGAPLRPRPWPWQRDKPYLLAMRSAQDDIAEHHVSGAGG